MASIRVKTRVNEYTNTHYYTTFDIESEKPDIEQEFDPRTGTRIVDVLPVFPDLQCDNVYTPDYESFFELWAVKVLTDEEDESCVDYRYIAVPVEPDLELYEEEECDD